MTNPTTHGQVPAIQRYKIGYHSDECGQRSSTPSGIPDASGSWVRYEDHAAELRRLHAYCQELESHLILDCMTHVQNPAENEHVAGDVSKNGAELNMSAQQPAPASQQAGEMPESIEQLAVARYKVAPAHESMFHRWAVVAGDGEQQLYLGREVECENMARKFAGAFLDGAFAFHSMLAAAPTHPAAPADSVQEDAARLTTEQEYAIRQGHEIAASEAYFGARSKLDTNRNHNIFTAGFERGWDAARKQGGA